MFLCLMLCLAGTTMPTASAAIITASSKTALVSYLQQEYLMRDAYQNIFGKYPTLTTFNAVAADEGKARLAGDKVLQVVALKTPVVPPPSIRPFPAPVTTCTVTVPASIDATGTTDVSTALTNFILGVPDGSLINFPSTAVYRVDKAIKLGFAGRHNFILDGNGCTLKYTSVTGTNQNYSLWYDQGAGSDIWIRDFVLIGSSTHPGVYTAGTSPTGGEGQHGVIVQSGRVEVSGCTISAVWGDGLYVSQGASDVWFHDNHVISAGRNGVSVISGTNIIAERNAFDKIGFIIFDDEPNLASESSTNIIFRLNTAGTWGQGFAYVEANHTGAPIHGVTISDNTVTGSSIRTMIDNGGTSRMTDIVFTNNKSTVPVSGLVLIFAHVGGLTVTGNVQPLTSGVLTRITDCTEAGTP